MQTNTAGKTAHLMALGCALALGGAALAQETPPAAAPAPAPGAASTTETTTTTTTTTSEDAPAEATTVEETTTTTERTLPATGGAPLWMALTGALTAGSALFGLRKLR